jgi:8-oxo-dGTP pyrophosphatase MutT (NUDIX family)
VTFQQVRDAFADAEPAIRAQREHLVSRGSAVLVPLYEQDGDVHVVLTRRSPDLRVHSGEVSFPGGGQDPGEDLTDTARREALEEIDLSPELVEIVGQLDHLSTITSDSFIVPFVGLLAGGRPALTPNPGEVDAVLHVALSELMLPEVYREERWSIFGEQRSIFFFELYGDTVWGATAAMLRQFLGLVTGTLGRGELAHS